MQQAVVHPTRFQSGELHRDAAGTRLELLWNAQRWKRGVEPEVSLQYGDDPLVSIGCLHSAGRSDANKSSFALCISL